MKSGIDKFNQPGVTSKQPAVARGKAMSYGPTGAGKKPLAPTMVSRTVPHRSQKPPTAHPAFDVGADLAKSSDHCRTMASQHRRKGR